MPYRTIDPTDVVTTGTAYVGDVRISGNTVETVGNTLQLNTVDDKVVH